MALKYLQVQLKVLWHAHDGLAKKTPVLSYNEYLQRACLDCTEDASRALTGRTISSIKTKPCLD